MYLVLKTRSLRQVLCLAWFANTMGRAGSAEVALGVTATGSLCLVVLMRHAGSRLSTTAIGLRCHCRWLFPLLDERSASLGVPSKRLVVSV